MLFSLAPFQNLTVCVAVSGGMDSMALLHCFASHRKGYALCAVNCEHGIRGEKSLQDTEFVKRYCAENGILLYCFAEDCPQTARAAHVSLETAAREFRYRVFFRLLAEGKADCIVTAHHADDNAETLLFRLCRGTSLTGMRGIGDRPNIVRPLIGCTRAEIEAYVRAHQIPYVEDETNRDTDYTRNFLRHDILPKLNKVVPGASGNISRFARSAAEDDALLYELSASLLTGQSVFFSSRRPLFVRACLTQIKAMGVEHDYTAAHLESLFALQEKENGKRITLPGGLIAVREYDRITFYRAGETRKEVPFCTGEIPFGDQILSVCEGAGELRFDLDTIPAEAVVRTRQKGDRFRKFGGGEKSLGDWMTDRKIPLRLRDEIPLVAAGREVLIVVGYEISDQVKLTPNSVKKYSISRKEK